MMKHTLCAKCESKDLWHIERVATRESGIDRGLGLLLALDRHKPSKKKEGLLKRVLGPSSYRAGEVDALICDRCGYTEFWTRDRDFVHNPEDGVHFLGSSN